jgi:outer membrane protein TolC
VATGPLGSLEASRLPNLAHPVIGTWILDTEIQQVPFRDGASGRRNFTYITVGNLLSADMAALDLVVEYDHLVVTGSAGWVAALPGDGSALDQVTDSRTSFVTGGGTVESILASLPDDADAIYLMPMIDMSSADITVLLAAFTERRLPVLSLIGEPEVRAGALLGVAPDDWQRRMYRRVALVAGQILSGEEAADIPVMMMRDGRLFLNLRTADLIGVSPSFETIIEAVLIDELIEPGTERLDLYDVMAAAQSHNRDIAAVESAVAAGHEQVKVVMSELLPQINLGLSGQLVDENTASFFPPLSERTFSGNASLTQIIYSDRAWSGYSIEKHLQDARIGELNKVRLDVGLEAATAYIDVLRAQTRLQIQRQNLTFSRSNLGRAQVRVSVGEANRSELYRWESKIAAEQALVMDAAVNRRLAGVELNRVLNRPLEAPLELVDTTLGNQYSTLIDSRIDRYTRNPRSLEVLREFLVQKGLVGSPELQQFDAAILAAERSHSAATRSFWIPDVGLQGSVGQVFSRGGEGSPTTDPGASDETSWNVGVFLSLPLFEGGARIAETQRTTQETHRLTRAREAAAQRVDREVRDAVFLVASSRLTIDLARKAAEAARLNLKLVADNYTFGLVSLVDLLDAQTNSFNTDLAAADAVNNYLTDLMRMERAVGQFTFFVPAEERDAWIEELEAYGRERQ